MAAHERLTAKTSIASPTLLQRLATVLPKDYSFKIYHLSTPPTRTSAIYSPPPNTRPDRTYCESHFLAVSINTSAKSNGEQPTEVLIYALEVLIYSTAYDSTFFVSKADSTGYLHHLGLQKGTPSPLRDISSTFLLHLVDQHQRPGIRSVVSLFARAQDQYLFPGSVEYSGKHVLDDRGLVRWWCRVLDSLIEESGTSAPSRLSLWANVKGYLTIPGLDSHDTRSYVPKKTSPMQYWTIGHPLQEISRFSNDVPPRCLIPHYPDDPKARYLDELDDEITKGKDSGNGQWKSVRTIDQFWDMMAFRQECSAGRMVGFIWIVFTPQAHHDPTETLITYSQSTSATVDSQMWNDSTFLGVSNSSSFQASPSTSFVASSQLHPTSSPLQHKDYELPPCSPDYSRSPKGSTSKKKQKKLTGAIIPRQPRIKTENRNAKNDLLERPENTPYYKWQPEGRGQIILDESGYKRVTELLLRLDFANHELATSSSKRWIYEVRSGASGNMAEIWGQVVTGSKTLEIPNLSTGIGVATLNMGLMRKKRKVDPEEQKDTPTSETTDSTPKVNILGAGMIRKKAKV